MDMLGALLWFLTSWLLLPVRCLQTCCSICKLIVNLTYSAVLVIIALGRVVPKCFQLYLSCVTEVFYQIPQYWWDMLTACRYILQAVSSLLGRLQATRLALTHKIGAIIAAISNVPSRTTAAVFNIYCRSQRLYAWGKLQPARAAQKLIHAVKALCKPPTDAVHGNFNSASAYVKQLLVSPQQKLTDWGTTLSNLRRCTPNAVLVWLCAKLKQYAKHAFCSLPDVVVEICLLVFVRCIWLWTGTKNRSKATKVVTPPFCRW